MKPFRHLRYLTSRLLSVMTLAALLVVLLAVPALAHHPEIAASVDCNGLVDFTASAWVPDPPDDVRRENHDIRVELRTYDGSSWSSYSEIAQGQFLPTQEPPFEFSGDYQLGSPLPEMFQLRVHNLVKWGPNEDLGDLGERFTEEIAVPPCPPAPSVQFSVNCDAGGANISFSNTGGLPVNFSLAKDGQALDQLSLPAGGSTARTYPMEENEVASFKVTAAEFSKSETLTFDCLDAAAEVAAGKDLQGQVAGEQLPATGPRDFVLAALAGILLLAGAGVTQSGKLDADLILTSQE